jgi:hypothetical protein
LLLRELDSDRADAASAAMDEKRRDRAKLLKPLVPDDLWSAIEPLVSARWPKPKGGQPRWAGQI